MNRVLGSTLNIPLPFALLAVLSACSAPETDEHAEATVASTASLLEEEMLCHEGASPPPLRMGWSFDTDAVLQSSVQTPVLLGLEAREDLTIELRLVSEGLDARVVSRAYGSYALQAGKPITVEVLLADLPLQAVSHSATGSVEATITRADGTTVTMHSPPFQHHFSHGYGSIVTYPYHAMIEHFHGGQISQEAFEVEGRVYIDQKWRDIEEQRLIEYPVPIDFAPPIDVVVTEQMVPFPPLSLGQRLCVGWRTQYLDAAHGEDIANRPGVQDVDASYALVTIEKVAGFSGCAAYSPGECGDIVWQGALDSNGCTRVPNSAVGDHYFVWLYGQVEREIDGTMATGEIRYYPYDTSIGIPAIRLDTVHLSGGEGFSSPYERFGGANLPHEVDRGQKDHVFAVWHEWQNAAAVMSLLFKSPFVTPGSSLTVHANLDCPPSTNPAIVLPPGDACARGDEVYTGWWTELIAPHATVRWTEPGMLQYKYVLAHEMGHTAMHNGSGSPQNVYDYGEVASETCDTSLPDSCGCCHVDGSNHLHCLQSLEHASAAQVEGFGQFVAASLFNDRGGSDCRFNYYKEFREDDATVAAPPYSVDCRNPVRWRDNHCSDFLEGGTEYDWMQFYWNVNNVVSSPSTVDDLFTIYQGACSDRWCDFNDEVLWRYLDGAAVDHFGQFDPRYIAFVNRGNVFGVDEDL